MGVGGAAGGWGNDLETAVSQPITFRMVGQNQPSSLCSWPAGAKGQDCASVPPTAQA